MRLVFVRHGAPRRGETDPGLTSAGRRMAFETGGWLATQQLAPQLIWHTPTRRTQQTAEELALSFQGVALSAGAVSPEVDRDWERLEERLNTELMEGSVGVLVGHHPTVELLLGRFGPPPVPVPLRNLAVALVLVRVPGGTWSIQAAWPGRPDL